MGKQYDRREFLKGMSATLVTTLISPSLIYAATKEELQYSYATPTKRDDLRKIPEQDLLARMIFGESRGCPTVQEKILIGQTALNRMSDGKKYTGENSLREVLLKQNRYKGKLCDQYSCFCDTIPKIKNNFYATLDPKKYEPKKWEESLLIVNILLEGSFDQFNLGQTIYVTKELVKKWEEKNASPLWFRRSEKVEHFTQNEHLFKHEFYKEPA